MAVLNWARAISGILPTHASYRAIKSSHSGTPILSPVDEAVLVEPVVVAALLELPVVELPFIVSVLLHPISTNAHKRQKAKKVLVSIGESSLSGFGGTRGPHKLEMELKSAEIIHVK